MQLARKGGLADSLYLPTAKYTVDIDDFLLPLYFAARALFVLRAAPENTKLAQN